MRALQLAAHTPGNRISLAALLLGALTTRCGVAEAFFGDGDLAAQLLGALALIGNESRQLGAPCFGGRALA